MSGDQRTPTWASVKVGSAKVTFGKPYYGKRKIIANAPLSANGFHELMTALAQAESEYRSEEIGA